MRTTRISAHIMIKLADVRKENKAVKNSVKGNIKFLYQSDGKETKKLLALYGTKAQVFNLAERIEKDMRIGEQAKKADGTLRVSKSGNAIIVKVSIDLVTRWFVANQEKAAEIVAEVAAEQAAAEQAKNLNAQEQAEQTEQAAA